MKLILFLALLAGLAAFVLWKARAHEARAVAAFPPEGRLIEVNGHRVHAVIMGAGPDLVLIHGASGNTRDLTFDLAPRLAARYRVILLDRPGLGHTDRIDGDGASIIEQAALLQAAAATLGAGRPIVMGHSYGGAVALAWAVTRPEHVAALVILAGASHPWQSALPLEYRLLSHPVIGPLVAPVLSAFVPDAYVERAVAGIFAPQDVPEGYISHVGAALTLRRNTLRENALQRAHLLAEIKALHPHYPQITAPTEIVHGDRDTTVGLSIHAGPLARDIPDARLTTLPGIGHMPHHAAPDQVIAAIDRAAARAGLRPAP
ncbi:MAG: alpha/beta hydrolase [Alphaproteobacteria bacterium HGW-Alphaproteobacteria-1]|nr:MAG: alpha/beta hydrolase [Alphaproteobacteria bacterium HGW-Alphaproteobacteria-1]